MNGVNSIKNYSNNNQSLEYLPKFFDLNDEIQKKELFNLLHSGKGSITVHDEIQSQLRELIKVRNPRKRKISDEEYFEAIVAHLNGNEEDQYGLWVYYPWSKNLVHILPENEFIELRTSRNKYKITKDEQDVLSSQKIGIIGLSVGQSIALTMAIERTFGEIRLADFDTIELTNLNRIRTGIQNLGIPKTIIAAREIAEIDPFLKVICFQEGITEENIDDFFMNGGKLDILVEECDGIDVKILARIKAKEFRVPVVMDTSDRGMIDVERFDLEPNRALLHGLIGEFDPKHLKNLTNEEKIPFLLPIVGVDTMSSRLKASAIEVGQTITTWPQLATSVILGGALAGDVCRRISLGQFNRSGRFFMDIDELIADDKVPNSNLEEICKGTSSKPLTKSEMLKLTDEIEFTIHPNQIKISLEQLNIIVKASGLAPSKGNSQPWRWLYKDSFLHLFLDKSGSNFFLDSDNASSLISLGTSIENAVLKTHQLGLETNIIYHNLTKDSQLIASFSFFKITPENLPLEPHGFDHLANQIEKRNTNRKNPENRLLEVDTLNGFIFWAKQQHGINLQIVTDKDKIEIIGNIIGSIDRINLLHKKSHEDFTAKELKWSDEELKKEFRGIHIDSLELNPLQGASLRMLKDTKTTDLLQIWGLGNSLEYILKKNFQTETAIGLLTIKGNDPLSLVEGGRFVEKLWLLATEKKLALHPISGPIDLFRKLFLKDTIGYTTEIINELKTERKIFETIFETRNDMSEVFLFRVFNAHEPKLKSIRQPIQNILQIG